MSAAVYLDTLPNVLVLLQMSYLLSELHMFCEKFSNIWILDAFFGQTRLEGSAYIGSSNPRRRDDDGVWCSNWLIWRRLQCTALRLQEG